MFLLNLFFKKLIQHGTLTIEEPNGRCHIYEGPHPGGRSGIRLLDNSIAGQMARSPRLEVPQAYVDGRLEITEGTLYDFLELCAINIELMDEQMQGSLLRWIMDSLTNFQHHNPLARAQKNVAHHYDLSGELFDLFLDTDRQYSCAYFQDPADDIETAQKQKKRHLAAKLLLEPGQEVLDIGCGWGGLALYLASVADVKVTGLTLSTEQHAVATRRAEEAGLSDRVTFKLQDYRHENREYDRIVSVGMFEHVGNLHYREFFDKLRDLIKADGLALIHTIGRSDRPAPINPWMRKYIFPGSYLPSFSQIAPHLDRLGLWLTDMENLRLHYAETLRLWNQTFQEKRGHVAELYDEKFCRMWEIYLQGCETGFRHNRLTVFQMQIAKQIDAVPMTRDYISAFEQRYPLLDTVMPPAADWASK